MKHVLMIAVTIAALFGQSKPEAPSMLDVIRDAAQYERTASEAQEDLKRLEKDLTRYDREARNREFELARKAGNEAEARWHEAETRCHPAGNYLNAEETARALEEADRLDQEWTQKRKDLRHAQVAFEVAQSLSDPERERLVQQAETYRATIERAAAVAHDLRELAAAMEQSEKRKELLRQMKAVDVSPSTPASKGERK